MKITAAILWERGQPLSVEDAELDPPGPGEILVEIKAAGVCHSDLHPARDEWPLRTPVTLGHEGAGVVLEVGPDVKRLKPGDHVVLCWAPACGHCPSCAAGRGILCDRLDRTTFRNKLPSGAARLHARGKDIAPFLSTACFATHTVIAEEGAVTVTPDVPFEALATLGCAVVTGIGAVLTAARVPGGATMAVIGAGGVGLNVIQGGVLAGAGRIIAIDRHQVPLELARAFGATEVVQASNVTDQVKALTSGRGAEFVFDTVGSPATLSDALGATAKGGTVVVTGLSRVDATGNVPLFPFVMQEKRLIGSAYGSGQPLEDIVRLVEWYRQGRLKLKELASRTYPLQGINQALDDLAASTGARGIVLPGMAGERAVE